MEKPEAFESPRHVCFKSTASQVSLQKLYADRIPKFQFLEIKRLKP